MAEQLGFKIKTARRKIGLSQAKLAHNLKISASYLNLIESGKRKVTVDLLLQIAQHLHLDIQDLSKNDSTHLYHHSMDLLSDNLFEDLDITNIELKDFVDIHPTIAKALIRLGDFYKKKNQDIFEKVEKISGEHLNVSQSTFPSEIISDFLQERNNYFPLLEDYATKIYKQVERNQRVRYTLLCDYLLEKHHVQTQTSVPKMNQPFSKIYDAQKKILYLSDFLNHETKKLFCASQIVQLEALDLVESLLDDFVFSNKKAIKLTIIALINYTAAAILMPYQLFYEKCRQYRYDLELLQHTFSTSFEQVAHRITCMQNPQMQGIPFHMLRTDIAGNISKRISLSGIQIPRYGGACPRWNIYSAFMNHGKIHVAVSKMTDGEKYICIAKSVEKGVGCFGMQRNILSIGIGCQMIHEKDFVYADYLNLDDEKSIIPIGVNCRTCNRIDCHERAFPPIEKNLNIDFDRRGVSVYVNV